MSKIEWTGKTWNPIVGCSKVSEGCRNCYALKDAWRMAHNPATKGTYGATVKAGADGKAHWTGCIGMNPGKLTEPLDRKKPTTWFVNSMGDLFHESVTDEQIDRVFAVMAASPQHTFQILTKRPERMQEWGTSTEHDGDDGYLPGGGTMWRVDEAIKEFRGDLEDGVLSEEQWAILEDGIDGTMWPLRNVWLGVSVEDQATVNERIPHLLNTPAAVRFVSYEPALGAVDFTHYPGEMPSDPPGPPGFRIINFLEGTGTYANERSGYPRMTYDNEFPKLDWIIAGGESGPGARPAHPEWFRKVRDDCEAAGVPFFFKGWGDWGNVFYDGRESIYLGLDGTTCSMPLGGGYDSQSCYPWAFMCRIGKKTAGRLMDGMEHNGMPERGRCE